MPSHADEIRNIRTFPSLVKYLRDELEWPIEGESFDDLTFDYEPDELGLDAKSAVKVKEIKQLRPLADGQPWGIFFVSFEQKKLPIVVLRRILRALVVKKRASANRSQQAVWSLHDLLFISSFGEKDHRELTLAHFSEPHDRDLGDLPTLHVLGWDEDDTRLKLDKVAQKLNEDLHWPEDPSDVEGWREKWSHAFKLRVREVVTTSQDLAVRLAGLAQRIRKRANQVLSHESENGPLRKLHKGFQAALIHDLSEDDFADMYAQTITYGLFSAACSRPAGVIAENLADMVPVTNPFLKETLETFLTVGGRKGRIDFDELGIQEVVDLLNSKDTHLEAVLRDFGNRRQQEDPVIHFYELFLKEYDNAKKVQRGVFYTPQPVVSYIVRSVHELLQTEFSLEEGLASTVTWGEMAKRTKDLDIPKGTNPDQPFVTILDPATGTATFLVEAIDLIHRTMMAKWEKEGWREAKRQDAWNEYVPKHLLPRLHGYELMMAPYAIAHMKIGLKLIETGYCFESKERARVFLTNALEPAHEIPKLLFDNAPALAREAKEVNEIKQQQRFTVVIGNPPYAQYSMNLTETAKAHIKKFRTANGMKIKARNALQLERNLNDDYVKFLGFSSGLFPVGSGVQGMITNRMFLDSDSLVGLREWFSTNFRKLYLLDLWGSSEESRRVARLASDENVFDILQGVAISFVVGRNARPTPGNPTMSSEMIGGRGEKYHRLSNGTSISSDSWSTTIPCAKDWWLKPKEAKGDAGISEFLLSEIFPKFSTLVASNRDHIVVNFEKSKVIEAVDKVREYRGPNEKWSEAFNITLKTGWNVNTARAKLSAIKDVGKFVAPIEYRAFDRRWIFFHPTLVWQAAPVVSNNIDQNGTNKILVSLGKNRAETINGQWVSSFLADKSAVSTRDNASGFPLFLFPSEEEKNLGGEGKRPNLSPIFLRSLSAQLNLPQVGPYELPENISPSEIFYYIYGLLYSPSYRTQHTASLKDDFPLIPIPRSLALFRAAAQLGDELAALHLMESPKLGKLTTEFIGSRKSEVKKVSWSKNTVWLDKEQTAGFKGIREDVWNFKVGEYQVCEKWLKDRKGRTLSKDDIAHYQKIVVALSETIRLMKEIDEVIEKHGGWPGAFASAKDLKAQEDPKRPFA